MWRARSRRWQRALALAEPEGYVRVFVDEGPPMAALLKLAAKQPDRPGYVRRLLARRERRRTDARAASSRWSSRSASGSSRSCACWGATSTARTSHASSSVSLNTVRTHTKSIYAKLGVNSRRAAVRRAAELGLL